MSSLVDLIKESGVNSNDGSKSISEVLAKIAEQIIEERGAISSAELGNAFKTVFPDILVNKLAQTIGYVSTILVRKYGKENLRDILSKKYPLSAGEELVINSNKDGPVGRTVVYFKDKKTLENYINERVSGPLTVTRKIYSLKLD